jgi:hypothetical protein
MARKPKRPREVFLSHAARDHRFADRIAQLLIAHGVPVFYSPLNIVGAQQWHDEIGQALARCDWFMLLLSQNAVRSFWVKHELLYALRSPQYHERIVPLHYKPCDHDRLSWTLRSTQYVDFTGPFEKGGASLLRMWGIGLRRSAG